MLSPLMFKLIMSGVVALLVGAAYLYVTGLQNKVEQLETQNTILVDDNKELKGAITDMVRTQGIVEKVSKIGDEERKVSRKARDNQLKQIDTSVREGKDRPVGPLLKEFFNAQ